MLRVEPERLDPIVREGIQVPVTNISVPSNDSDQNITIDTLQDGPHLNISRFKQSLQKDTDEDNNNLQQHSTFSETQEQSELSKTSDITAIENVDQESTEAKTIEIDNENPETLPNNEDKGMAQESCYSAQEGDPNIEAVIQSGIEIPEGAIVTTEEVVQYVDENGQVRYIVDGEESEVLYVLHTEESGAVEGITEQVSHVFTSGDPQTQEFVTSEDSISLSAEIELPYTRSGTPADSSDFVEGIKQDHEIIHGDLGSHMEGCQQDEINFPSRQENAVVVEKIATDFEVPVIEQREDIIEPREEVIEYETFEEIPPQEGEYVDEDGNKTIVHTPERIMLESQREGTKVKKKKKRRAKSKTKLVLENIDKTIDKVASPDKPITPPKKTVRKSVEMDKQSLDNLVAVIDAVGNVQTAIPEPETTETMMVKNIKEELYKEENKMLKDIEEQLEELPMEECTKQEPGISSRKPRKLATPPSGQQGLSPIQMKHPNLHRLLQQEIQPPLMSPQPSKRIPVPQQIVPPKQFQPMFPMTGPFIPPFLPPRFPPMPFHPMFMPPHMHHEGQMPVNQDQMPMNFQEHMVNMSQANHPQGMVQNHAPKPVKKRKVPSTATTGKPQQQDHPTYGMIPGNSVQTFSTTTAPLLMAAPSNMKSPKEEPSGSNIYNSVQATQNHFIPAPSQDIMETGHTYRSKTTTSLPVSVPPNIGITPRSAECKTSTSGTSTGLQQRMGTVQSPHPSFTNLPRSKPLPSPKEGTIPPPEMISPGSHKLNHAVSLPSKVPAPAEKVQYQNLQHDRIAHTHAEASSHQQLPPISSIVSTMIKKEENLGDLVSGGYTFSTIQMPTADGKIDAKKATQEGAYVSQNSHQQVTSMTPSPMPHMHPMSGGMMRMGVPFMPPHMMSMPQPMMSTGIPRMQRPNSSNQRQNCPPPPESSGPNRYPPDMMSFRPPPPPYHQWMMGMQGPPFPGPMPFIPMQPQQIGMLPHSLPQPPTKKQKRSKSESESQTSKRKKKERMSVPGTFHPLNVPMPFQDAQPSSNQKFTAIHHALLGNKSTESQDIHHLQQQQQQQQQVPSTSEKPEQLSIVTTASAMPSRESPIYKTSELQSPIMQEKETPTSKDPSDKSVEKRKSETLADKYMNEWKPTGKFQCKFCHYSCVTKNFLFRHWVTNHCGLEPYMCPYCGQRSSNRHGITWHQTTKHKDKPRKILVDTNLEGQIVQQFQNIFHYKHTILPTDRQLLLDPSGLQIKQEGESCIEELNIPEEDMAREKEIHEMVSFPDDSEILLDESCMQDMEMNVEETENANNVLMKMQEDVHKQQIGMKLAHVPVLDISKHSEEPVAENHVNFPNMDQSETQGMRTNEIQVPSSSQLQNTLNERRQDQGEGTSLQLPPMTRPMQGPIAPFDQNFMPQGMRPFRHGYRFNHPRSYQMLPPGGVPEDSVGAIKALLLKHQFKKEVHEKDHQTEGEENKNEKSSKNLCDEPQSQITANTADVFNQSVPTEATEINEKQETIVNQMDLKNEKLSPEVLKVPQLCPPPKDNAQDGNRVQWQPLPEKFEHQPNAEKATVFKVITERKPQSTVSKADTENDNYYCLDLSFKTMSKGTQQKTSPEIRNTHENTSVITVPSSLDKKITPQNESHEEESVYVQSTTIQIPNQEHSTVTKKTQVVDLITVPSLCHKREIVKPSSTSSPSCGTEDVSAQS